MVGRPDMAKKFELDYIACRGQLETSVVNSKHPLWQSNVDTIMEGCMADRGYVSRETTPGMPTASIR